MPPPSQPTQPTPPGKTNRLLLASTILLALLLAIALFFALFPATPPPPPLPEPLPSRVPPPGGLYVGDVLVMPGHLIVGRIGEHWVEATFIIAAGQGGQLIATSHEWVDTKVPLPSVRLDSDPRPSLTRLTPGTHAQAYLGTWREARIVKSLPDGVVVRGVAPGARPARIPVELLRTVPQPDPIISLVVEPRLSLPKPSLPDAPPNTPPTPPPQTPTSPSGSGGGGAGTGTGGSSNGKSGTGPGTSGTGSSGPSKSPPTPPTTKPPEPEPPKTPPPPPPPQIPALDY